MPRLRINGVDYHYETQGAGQPLLLLHGFSGSSGNWQSHVDLFARSYSTIAVDLLGHGQTDAPADPARHRMEEAARDIVALLDALVTEPAHLLGYSMGGRLALYLALFYPESMRSLILESASPGLETAEARRQRLESDEQLAEWIEQNGVPSFVERWEQIPLFASQRTLPAAVRKGLRQQRLQNQVSGLANSLRGMGTGAQPSLWPRLGDLQVPALLLAGALDTKFVVIGQQMAARIPQAELTIVPDAGHTVHLERPQRFGEIVCSFLGK